MLRFCSPTSETISTESKIFVQLLAIILVFSLAGALVHFRRINLSIERELGDVNREMSVVKSENSDLRRRITELASPVRVLASVRGDTIEDESSKPKDIVITQSELEASKTAKSEDLFVSATEEKEESFIASLGNSAFFTGSAHAKE